MLGASLAVTEGSAADPSAVPKSYWAVEVASGCRGRTAPHGVWILISAAPVPAARQVAQAHRKLCPPIGPNASRISPQRNRPLCGRLSIVRGWTSPSATPPPVTSALAYPAVVVQGRG